MYRHIEKDEKKATATLRDWNIQRFYGKVTVVGTIYGDTKGRFNDGDTIRTSSVLKADFVSGVLETRNSIYLLED